MLIKPGTLYFNRMQRQLNVVLSVNSISSVYDNIIILTYNGKLCHVDIEKNLTIDQLRNWEILNDC